MDELYPFPRVFFGGFTEDAEWFRKLVPDGNQEIHNTTLIGEGFKLAGPFPPKENDGGKDLPGDMGLALLKEETFGWRRMWIEDADLYFAWIETESVCQTLIEIGWAQTWATPTYLAFANRGLLDRMRFALIGPRIHGAAHGSPEEGLRAALAYRHGYLQGRRDTLNDLEKPSRN